MGLMGGGAGGGGAGGGGAGGGGAGGGGAGGGGAGGGGAGGGGAGGGGAGGGGAGGGTGHAGGPSSALLNTALIVTQDAVTGFWDGAPDTGVNPLAGLPGDDRPLEHLDPSRRVTMLISELASRFVVSGTASRVDDKGDYHPGQAMLQLDGCTVFETTAPTVADLEHQLTWLRNYSDLRFDRVPEINNQLGDILSFIGLAGQLDSGARKYSLELLTATQALAYGLEMQIKNLCWTPRPIAFSTKVQPMIQTPDHSSYPSGHATEAFALATVLHRLMDPGADLRDAITGQKNPQAMVFRIAHRVAVNRTVAGVHFPVDSAAGAVLGCMIGEAVWAVLTGAKTGWKAKFDLGEIDKKDSFDFLLSRFPDHDWEDWNIPTPAKGPVTAAYLAETAAEWGRK